MKTMFVARTRSLTALIIACLAGMSLPSATASVVAYAQAGGPPATPGVDPSATASGNAGAHASVSIGGGQTTTGSGPFDIYNINNCAPCEGSVTTAAFATGNGVTGAVHAFVAAGLLPGSQLQSISPYTGSTFARVTMEDMVTFHSPSAAFILDAFYREFRSSRTASMGSRYETNTFYQLSFQLSNVLEDGALDPIYQATLEMNDTFLNQGIPVDARSYSVCEGIAPAPCLPVLSGTQFPQINGHLSFSNSIDLTGFEGVPLALFFQIQTSAVCSGGGTASGPCTSISDTWNTSYLGLQGQFTSVNGYQYLGAPATAGVPEPSSLLLIGLSSIAGLAWRWRRGVRT